MVTMQQVLDAIAIQTTLVQQIKDLVTSGATQEQLQAAFDNITANTAQVQAVVLAGTPAPPPAEG